MLTEPQLLAYINYQHLDCKEHDHLSKTQLADRIRWGVVRQHEKRIAVKRVIPKADRTWQAASGWTPRPSGKFIVMQLITEKHYRAP